ncbi:IclR family transcriptional regulator [Pseudolysinimonas kribbensis]|uniref:Transcriptional regulator n=1 Tax=Pseudolysinimonas kribbensis TaxID=433641 RepID=A0ABQ6KCJ5_9MICO|nr:IclR family transcriptional regulator [Pseudolysinimonas kribbensis]GMA96201.1 transcriptional regulator [Pseudolysinimonas kribbensis]
MTLEETRDADEASAVRRRNRHNTADKVVMLLRALADRPEGIGVRELARELGIDKSAVSRLFEQLADLDIAQQDEFSGRFRVGPELFALAATIHSRDTLWQAAEPILRELAATFNETCYLAVREGDEIIFRDKIDTTHPLRYVIDAGERAPLHAGAGGRAVLMTMSDEEIRAFAKRTGLPEMTEHTISDPEELVAAAHADRSRGYAVSHGERVLTGGAIAAPFFDGTGACRGTIAFTSPAQRFDAAQEPDIAAAVIAAAHQLSVRLGHA